MERGLDERLRFESLLADLAAAFAVVGPFACSMQHERDWPADLVHRPGLLADSRSS